MDRRVKFDEHLIGTNIFQSLAATLSWRGDALRFRVTRLNPGKLTKANDD
jgi:hypothetical protein